MTPDVLALLTGIGGLVVSGYVAWGTRHWQQEQADTGLLATYDKLVQTLQGEIKRRDDIIADLRAQITVLERRRRTTQDG